MAKKAASKAGPNKSEAIRKYKAENPEAGPQAIAAALKEQGVKTTPAFVSTVLSNDKRKSKPASRRGTSGNASTVESLLDAKKFADQVGGADVAINLLHDLKRLIEG